MLVVFSAVEEVVLDILNAPIAAIAVGVVFMMKSVMILAQVAVSSAEARKVCNIRPFGEGSVYFVALFDMSLCSDPAQLSGVMGGCFPEDFPLCFAHLLDGLISRGF